MRFELAAFKRKYDVQAFDEEDRLDMLAERARRRIIQAYIDIAEDEAARDGEETAYVIGGLLVGVACVAASHVETSDENHASIRSSIIEMAPWAVDMMRQIGDAPLPPLSSDT